MAGATRYRKVVYVALKISKISSDLAQVSNLLEYSTPIRSSLGTFLGINTGKDVELGCASYCVEARYAALPAAHFCAAEFETSSPWMLSKLQPQVVDEAYLHVHSTQFFVEANKVCISALACKNLYVVLGAVEHTPTLYIF